MWFWRKYSGRIEHAIPIPGDPKAYKFWWMPTIIARELFWDEVTLFDVPSGVEAYQVGFIPTDGKPRYLTTVLRCPRFAMRHGPSSVRVFAVKPDGTELVLKDSPGGSIERLSSRVFLAN
jgi:hypothetical protein